MNNKILVYIVIIFIIFCIISKKVSNLQENYYAPITKSTSNFKYNKYSCPYVFNCPTRLYPSYDLRGHPFNPNFVNHFSNRLFPYFYNYAFHPLALNPVYWSNIDQEEVTEILKKNLEDANKKK